MNTQPLVLSLFPGIGLLDMAFEMEGFCVVRGPDVLWGGDIRKFHPPAGKFDGVIGGPPCQAFSQFRRLMKAAGRDTTAKDLVPEYCRCVEAARPDWFLMENVKAATTPGPRDYDVHYTDVRDADVGGDTLRRRRFWYGTLDGDKSLNVRPLPRVSLLTLERAVTRNCRIPEEKHFAKARERSGGNGGVLPGDGRYMQLSDICELQGLPATYFNGSPFKVADIRIMLGNGVPIAMGRAIAKAVKEATADVARLQGRR